MTESNADQPERSGADEAREETRPLDEVTPDEQALDETIVLPDEDVLAEAEAEEAEVEEVVAEEVALEEVATEEAEAEEVVAEDVAEEVALEEDEDLLEEDVTIVLTEPEAEALEAEVEAEVAEVGEDPELVEVEEDETIVLTEDVLAGLAQEAEAEVLEAEVVEPEVAEAEAEVLEAEVAEPEVAEPEVAEPEPEVIEAEVVEPEVVEPEVVEPEAEVVEPEVVEPEPVVPQVIEPELDEPELIEPDLETTSVLPVEPELDEVEPEDDATTVLPEPPEPAPAPIQRTSVLRPSPAPVEPAPEPEPDPVVEPAAAVAAAAFAQTSVTEPVIAQPPSTEPAPAATEPAATAPSDPVAAAPAPAAPAATQPMPVVAATTAPPTQPPVERPMIEDLPNDPPTHRARKVWTLIAVVLVLLAGAYVGAVFYTAERTPATATVGGVDVSELPREDAETALTAGMAERVAAPVPIQVGDLTATLDPTRAGLTLDAPASIGQITGQSWDPRVVWERLFGSVDVPAVAAIDGDALTSALANAQSAVAVAPVDATIAFANGAPVVTDPVDGAGLDVPAAVEVISTRWLQTTDTLDLPMTAVTPDLDQSDVDAAMSEIVQPLLSAPVTVSIAPAEGTEGEPITASLDTATLTAASSVVGKDGVFVLEMHGDDLVTAVSASLPELGSASTDASFEFVDGKPSIIPSQGGTGLDAEQLAGVVEVAALELTGRVANAELITAEAEFTTAEAEALGIVEVIGEFSTPLPAGNDASRTNNIRNGASKVTGVLLLPGETFSLLDALGPIDGAHGYYQSGVVVNGNVSEAWGGGLSQLSTTVFNAAFEAGLEDVTHQAHSRWFTRYPPGREATVFEGQIDMQFKNRTDTGVLVQAWVADGRTWARVWGTKTFNTTITSGEKYNYVAPRTIYNTRADCTPESGGSSGFSIDVRRVVTRLDGTEVENRGYSTTYTPWNTIVCGPDPATVPDPNTGG